MNARRNLYPFSLILLLSIANYYSLAQVTFFNSYDSLSCHAVTEAIDGGFVIAGTDIPAMSTTNDNVCIIKVTNEGIVQWLKCYGGDSLEQPTSIIRTYDNCYLLAGETKSFGAGDYDMYVIKTDSMGDTLWTRSFGGPGIDRAEDIIESNDSNFIITGYLEDSLHEINPSLIKINQNGNIIWSRVYGTSGGTPRVPHRIIKTNDGGYLICGDYGIEFYLLKTDVAGNLMWDKHYSNFNPFGNQAYGVQETSDHGYIVCGTSGRDIITTTVELGEVYKTDSSGNVLWNKVYGDTTQSLITNIISLEKTFDGGFIMSGFAEFDNLNLYIQKIDDSGNLIWMVRYGRGNYALISKAIQCRDSSLLLIGDLGVNLSYSFKLIKTNSNGLIGCNDSVASISVYTDTISAIDASGTVIPSNIFASSTSTASATHNTSLISDCLFDGNREIPPTVSIECYPNPFKSEVYISLNRKTANRSLLIVRNLFGQTVFNQEENSLGDDSATILNLEFLESGVYFLEVITEGKRMTKLIVKI